MIPGAIARFSQPTSSTSKAQSLASASPAWKMLLMFASDPMLKTALAGRGHHGCSAGNAGIGHRKIVAIEVWALMARTILNVWAHATGADDEDERAVDFSQLLFEAMALAPLQGALVFRQRDKGLWSAATEEVFGEELPALQGFIITSIRQVPVTGIN